MERCLIFHLAHIVLTVRRHVRTVIQSGLEGQVLQSYMVIARGNQRATIFHDADDYTAYLDRLERSRRLDVLVSGSRSGDLKIFTNLSGGKSLISLWRGMVDVLPALRLT